MILDEIVTATRARVRSERAQLPLEHLQRAAAAPALPPASAPAPASPSPSCCAEAARPQSQYPETRPVDSQQPSLALAPLQTPDGYAATPFEKGAPTPPPPPDFAAALRAPGISFICEVKKASPSKGVIAADFPYLDIARDYEAAGAAAISVLTEPTFFQGSNDYLRDISGSVGLPCLRKDFIIDEYQIYQARQLGASAVLLIVAILHDCQLSDYLALTHRLGMAALVEVHDESELLRALAAGARIIGVNNRDLTTFTCDLAVTERLAPLVPADVLLVAESGITTAADVARMAAAGADAVLVGETLMRSADKTAALAELRGQLPVAGITRSAAPMLKICGLRRAADVAYVNEAYARYGTPEYAGFVFAPSKRQISPETAAGLRSDLDKRIKAVGVFVDQPLELIQQLVSAGTIELVQLHGGENQTYLDALRVLLGDVPVIKAVRMNEPGALEAALATSAEYLLLDSGAGSGETFDWAAVSAIDRPFFLAGGINIDNINAALTTLNPYAIDVSSGAETDGVKDAAKIAVLAQAVRGELA